MDLLKVESSNIDKIGYDVATHALLVEFKNYTVYIYNGVSEEVFKAFTEAESKGKFFSSEIRSKYEYFKLEAELFPVGAHASIDNAQKALSGCL